MNLLSHILNENKKIALHKDTKKIEWFYIGRFIQQGVISSTSAIMHIISLTLMHLRIYSLRNFTCCHLYGYRFPKNIYRRIRRQSKHSFFTFGRCVVDTCNVSYYALHISSIQLIYNTYDTLVHTMNKIHWNPINYFHNKLTDRLFQLLFTT